jgi:glutathione S-transferase
MLTLNTFGTLFGLPDPSPFCMKAMVLMKMSGLPHTFVSGDLRKAPKGKFPVLLDDGVSIPDSTFIRWHLEKKYAIDFDKGLSMADRAVACAFEKLCEDNLYWGLMSDRWTIDENFNKGPRHYFQAAPALIRPLIISKVRCEVRRNLHGHGLGRHSKSEIERITKQGIDAIAHFLGNKKFLLGDEPCGADAATFSWVSGFLCPLFVGAMHDNAKSHANLIAYRDRGMARWFPEFVL